MSSRVKQQTTGFTLIELIVVVALIVMMLAFTSVNLTGVIPKASEEATLQVLAADIKEQQLKAMSGDITDSTVSISQGVHFANDHYVLFAGTYSVDEPNNISFNYQKGMVLVSTSLPDNNLIFQVNSGEVISGSLDSYSVAILNQSNNQTIDLIINHYGRIEIRE